MVLLHILGQQYRRLLLQHCTDRTIFERFQRVWILSDILRIIVVFLFLLSRDVSRFGWSEFSNIHFHRAGTKE